MSTQQHLGVVQLVELLVVDGDESLPVQAFHLHAVVHDVAQAIEPGPSWASSSSALRMAVVTPKQKPLPLSISISTFI